MHQVNDKVYHYGVLKLTEYTITKILGDKIEILTKEQSRVMVSINDSFYSSKEEAMIEWYKRQELLLLRTIKKQELELMEARKTLAVCAEEINLIELKNTHKELFI